MSLFKCFACLVLALFAMNGLLIADVVDQSQTQVDYGYWFDYAAVRWQQFEPALASVTRVRVFIDKNGNPGNMIVELRTDAGGLLAQTVVPAAEISGGFVDAVFDDAVPVSPGSKYRIYISADELSPGPTNRYFWMGKKQTNPYPLGIADVYDSDPGFDYAFETCAMAVFYVPDDFLTIQAAIDAATDGDRIVVRPGTYTENIDFLGKRIAVESEKGATSTIIDGSQAGSVVTFRNGEGEGSVISSFTIRNGAGDGGQYGDGGGGIVCDDNACPTITENIITENTAFSGGGIYCEWSAAPTITENEIKGNAATYGGAVFAGYFSAPQIRRNRILENSAANGSGGGVYSTTSYTEIDGNIIRGNTATFYGGGIMCHADLVQAAIVVNNVIYENDAAWYGGGICCNNSGAFLCNNTIVRNTTAHYGGGIACRAGADVDAANLILRDNEAASGMEIAVCADTAVSTLNIKASNVDGGMAPTYVQAGCTLNWGSGMIDADPLFASEASEDFHLTWTSPCRNAGDNASAWFDGDAEGDPRIADGAVDMGADEYYYHLYHLGAVVPGGTIEVKTVGFPGAPITLYLGSEIQEPPLTTEYGLFWIKWPPLWKSGVGKAPGSGILVLSATVPLGWASGESYALQALVGPLHGPHTKLTNLRWLNVE